MPAPIRNIPGPISNSHTTYNNRARTLGQQGFIQPDQVFNKAQGLAMEGWNAVSEIVDRYMPAKIFLYCLLAASAFPVAVFAAITGSTLLGCLALAGSGIAIFQGIVLAVTGFILFWFLLGAFLFSATVGGWAAIAFFGWGMVQTVVVRNKDASIVNDVDQ
ncbi:hypothetical protein HDU98_008529 [Podochytrium sp. JEL0797]|nr:hypothetical protein HDU98_008529 [Podochytrium sp. JEL0797]